MYDSPPAIINRGREAYATTYEAMRTYTTTRTFTSPDELWLVEHDPVYTLGLAANPAHILSPTHIPVIKTDRGGEVTYHGPGQAIMYVLLDLKRRQQQGLVRELVTLIEEAVINTLKQYHIIGVRKTGAPGIYLATGAHQGAKIASLGLKISASGRTYHGVALNAAMDLTPFNNIHPCGYAHLACTDIASQGITTVPLAEVQLTLAHTFEELLKATSI